MAGELFSLEELLAYLRFPVAEGIIRGEQTVPG